MPRYRVFYLKDELGRRFRELPPGSVRKQIKAKDYHLAGEIDAPTEYAVWKALQDPAAALGGEARALAVGDALERDDGKLQLCVFGGFEDVTWWVPAPEVVPAEPGATADCADSAEMGSPEGGGLPAGVEEPKEAT